MSFCNFGTLWKWGQTTQLVAREQVGILERFVFGATRFSVPKFGEFCFGWSAEMSEKQGCGRAGEWQYSGTVLLVR